MNTLVGKHSRELPSDTSLFCKRLLCPPLVTCYLDKLNNFYARFEASNTEACMRASAGPDYFVITLSVADVSKTFKQVNIHKAAGPDELPGHVLRACADQLAIVFTDILNLSLTESVIPTCLKQTTIVMAHINTIIPETLDPLQFAYCPNRSTDNAISIALHTALSHLDKRNTYVRMLFIDYSSAFNTIVPSKLINNLRTL